ncbi:HAMP domain-containing sensor histidine kinase [uncultured Enterococcus sp.]|uniref:sensor histidine kinase n=1 Tax=uncultured Enterococcus sp. TaxID=167972 RepID=UPI002AA826DC|nr:HAMP domain-containing sensor histidine kinase [uncultured Enterococcus sp.]
MRMNMKIGIVISAFSLMITAAIVGGFYMFQKSLQSVEAGSVLGSSVYVMSNQEEISALETAQINVNADAILSTSELDDFYVQSFSQNLPMIIIVICGILVVSTLVLWLILKRIQMKQTISIIEELKRIDKEDSLQSLDNGIQQALSALRQDYAASLEDYKRLSSYMTHEQKNTIAVLKSNLEQQTGTEADLRLLGRLTDSVDDILTLAGNDDEELVLVDVSLICAEVCDSYRKVYPKLTFSFSEDKNLEILAKERWIYRAVSNLLDNAVKYGQEQNIHLAVTARKNSVIITVKDQGAGLDKETQEQIFEHKYRVNGLKQDGYGIGLSVVKHVCNLCRGSVYVESLKGHGSAFYLSFPSVTAASG